jgi:hypothetical protein
MVLHHNVLSYAISEMLYEPKHKPFGLVSGPIGLEIKGFRSTRTTRENQPSPDGLGTELKMRRTWLWGDN